MCLIRGAELLVYAPSETGGDRRMAERSSPMSTSQTKAIESMRNFQIQNTAYMGTEKKDSVFPKFNSDNLIALVGLYFSQ